MQITTTTTFPAVLLVVILSITSTANAFCFYNKADTGFRVGIDDDSPGDFFKLIEPGDSRCCNWQNKSCNITRRQYGELDNGFSYVDNDSKSPYASFSIIAGGWCNIKTDGHYYSLDCFDPDGKPTGTYNYT